MFVGAGPGGPEAEPVRLRACQKPTTGFVMQAGPTIARGSVPTAPYSRDRGDKCGSANRSRLPASQLFQANFVAWQPFKRAQTPAC